MVDVAKILVTGQNRIGINSCGIVGVLLHCTQQDIGYLQDEDLVVFGRLNISSPNNQTHVQMALDTINRVYSLDMHTCHAFLLQATENDN